MKRTSARSGVWAQVAVFVGSGIAIAFAAFYFIKIEPLRQFIARGPSDLAQEIAACRENGIPVDLQEIRPPTPPDSRNAAPDYDQLIILLKDKPDGIAFDKLVSVVGPVSASKEIAAVRKALDDRQDVMQLIHMAADKPLCVMDSAWTPDRSGSSAVFIAKLSIFRAASRILWAESFLLARDGHYLEAIENERRAFHIAEQVSSSPGILPYQVGLSCEAIALRSVDVILNMCKPDEKVAELARRVIQEPRPHLNLARALESETPITLALARTDTGGVSPSQQSEGDVFRTGKAVSSLWTNSSNLLSREEWTDASATCVLRKMLQLTLAARDPFPQRLDAFHSVCNAMRQEKASLSGNIGSVIYYTTFYNFLSTAAEAYFGVAVRSAYSEVQRDVTLSGTAVLAYRAEHAHFPDRLDAAISPVPIDPFTGNSLRYRLEPEGFVVYSLGESGTFGGGSPSMKRDSKQAYFRYGPQ